MKSTTIIGILAILLGLVAVVLGTFVAPNYSDGAAYALILAIEGGVVIGLGIFILMFARWERKNGNDD